MGLPTFFFLFSFLLPPHFWHVRWPFVVKKTTDSAEILQNHTYGHASGQGKQEALGLGALLDKMEDNDHINWITQRSRCIFHSKNCHF